MAGLKVLNPVARSLESRADPAPRLRDLNGKRIGLYWNIKAGGDVALQRIEELLAIRYPTARFAYYRGDVGFNMRYITEAGANRIAAECDAIVGTTAD